jgi:LacI family transcriptional regulator
MNGLGKKITVKDIARMAGVSIGTVDRVIHRRGRVSQETTQRVLEIIRTTGYVPDPLASRLSKDSKISLGVIMPQPHQDSGYWQLCLDGIQEAEVAGYPFGVTVQYFFFDRANPQAFDHAVHLASHGNCGGLAIAPVFQDRLIDLYNKGLLSGICGFFDSDVPEIPALVRVGQDSNAAGYMAGKLLTLVSDSTKVLGIVDLSDKDYHLQKRVEGFLRFIEEKKCDQQVKIWTYADSDNRSEIQSRVKRILQEEPNLGGLFVPNATTHLYGHALLPQVCLVGFDETQSNIEALKAGSIDFLISQRPRYQGNQVIQRLIQQLVFRVHGLAQDSEDSQDSDHIWVPIDLLTKENVEYWL